MSFQGDVAGIGLANLLQSLARGRVAASRQLPLGGQNPDRASMSSGSTGRHAFAERAGLASPERDHACRELLKRAQADGIEAVRLSFVDQHGILRGKTLVASELAGALANGCSMTSTLLTKDTSHRTVFAAFTADGGVGIEEMAGAADFLMVPDPASFRVLPWAEATGWLATTRLGIVTTVSSRVLSWVLHRPIRTTSPAWVPMLT